MAKVLPWMSIISKASGVKKSMVPELRVSYQVHPFNYLNDPPELALKLGNAAPTVRGCPPPTRMNLKLAKDVGHHIAVEHTIVSDPDSAILKILDFSVLNSTWTLAAGGSRREH